MEKKKTYSHVKDEQYQKLFEQAKRAFPNTSKAEVQQRCVNYWKEIKNETKSYSEVMKELSDVIIRNKMKFSKMFFGPHPSTSKREVAIIPPPSVVIVKSSSSPDNDAQATSISAPENDSNATSSSAPENDANATSSSAPEKDANATSSSKPTPAQDQLKKEIAQINEELVSYTCIQQRTGLSLEYWKRVQMLQKEKKEKERKLKRKIIESESQKKAREKKKRIMQQIKEVHPDVADKIQKLQVRSGAVGRRPVEDSIPGLHEVILDIVVPESGTDERRRSEIHNTIRTLDDLKTELENRGYSLKRTTLYYRLLPSNVRHNDAKRHVKTVPVRLCRPQSDLRMKHIDGQFAMASVKYAKEMASLFSSENVFFLSQDDKAKVPLGLPISKKQSAILMHVDYKVSLPDHDFPIGEKHKLIPSVYASCLKNKDGMIGYSGPTYIAIRSQKHDKSCAASHREDFITILNLPEFQKASRKEDKIKPLVFVSVDGGPDEAPKNEQTLAVWASLFTEYDLDMVFIFTHAPGSSAYNPVERRMAPLSRDTAGIILPFDTFGNHLDKSNKTKSVEIEKKNFKAAGEILAEVWSECVIDGHPVIASYIDPPQSCRERVTLQTTEAWKTKHVKQSQYMLQIVKCDDSRCCKPFRTNYATIFPRRFLPPPVPLEACNEGLKISEEGHFGTLFQALYIESIGLSPRCFDGFCPSLQTKNKAGKLIIERRSCDICGYYSSTIKAATTHKRHCNTSGDMIEEDDDDDSDSELEEQIVPTNSSFPEGNIFERISYIFRASD